MKRPFKCYPFYVTNNNVFIKDGAPTRRRFGPRLRHLGPQIDDVLGYDSATFGDPDSVTFGDPNSVTFGAPTRRRLGPQLGDVLGPNLAYYCPCSTARDLNAGSCIRPALFSFLPKITYICNKISSVAYHSIALKPIRMTMAIVRPYALEFRHYTDKNSFRGYLGYIFSF